MADNEYIETWPERINIGKLLKRYINFWPLFVITTVISFLVAWSYLNYNLPVYLTKASVLINDSRKGVDDTQLLSSFNYFSNNKIVENEIEVLRSRAVMMEVVKKLELYAPTSFVAKFRDIPGYVQSPICVELKYPELIEEQRKISFEYRDDSKRVAIKNQFYPLNIWINSEWGMIRFRTNRHWELLKIKQHISGAQSQWYFSLIPPIKVVDQILNDLEVTATSKLSTTVTLLLKDPLPQRSEDILNELLFVYNQTAIQYKNKLASNSLLFVEDRLKYVSMELDSVETAIQQYRTNKSIVDISEQGRVFLERVESNDQRISDINIQLSILDQVESYVKKKEGTPGLVPSTVGLSEESSSNPGILSQLLTKLNNLEMEHERLKKTTADNNPLFSGLTNQIQNLKLSIQENIENQKRNLASSKSNLQKVSTKYSSLLNGIPEKERQLLDITRQQSIKSNIYTFLLQKREEAILSFASSIANSRIIDPAQSFWAPIGPSRGKIFAIAIILALGMPLGFIAIRDFTNERVTSASDIKSLTYQPLIGEINIKKECTGENLLAKEVSEIDEQIWQIRSSLIHLGIKGSSNCISITSAGPNEGKTFVAINLALSLALSDRKVILLELDLRNPKLNDSFKVNWHIGLTDFLKTGLGADQIIYPTSVRNLYLIPSGEKFCYPSELIANGKMENLIDYIKSKYDYVIAVSAPIRQATDAYIVSEMFDATLYIVRKGKTLKEDIRLLEKNQRIKSLGKVGIVLNDFG